MPTYTFLCEKCKETFDTLSSIGAYTGKAKCPHCKKVSTTRDYKTDLPNGFVPLSDDQITVGHLAHRNGERYSDDQKEAIRRKVNAYKEGSPERELPKGMNRMRKNGKVEWKPSATKSPRPKPPSPTKRKKSK